MVSGALAATKTNLIMNETITPPKRGRPRKHTTPTTEHAVAENRLGRFSIRAEMIERWPELLPVFGQAVIIRCFPNELGRKFVYVAYSPLFDVLPIDQNAPEYLMAVREMSDGSVEVKAEKIVTAPGTQ